MRKKNLMTAAMVAGIAWMSAGKGFAQDLASQAYDEEIRLFRKDVRSMKKQIIAANMDLSDPEAQQFWPIYDQYTSELAFITDKKYALLKEYALNYTTMTSQQAENYIKGRADVEESIMQLRLKYLPIFRKVLSGQLTGLFFQIDWRLGLIMDLQLASQTPLIEP
jgi:hypothetical protein